MKVAVVMGVAFRVDAHSVEPIAAPPVALLCEGSSDRCNQVGIERLARMIPESRWLACGGRVEAGIGCFNERLEVRQR